MGSWEAKSNKAAAQLLHACVHGYINGHTSQYPVRMAQRVAVRTYASITELLSSNAHMTVSRGVTAEGEVPSSLPVPNLASLMDPSA